MKQLILILTVLALAGAGSYWLMHNKPEIKKRTKKPTLPIVKVAPLKLQEYRVIVHSSGTVEARTQTSLVAEVAGKVIAISPRFQEGNYFRKNDVLLNIDTTDYQNTIRIARADIAQKELALKEQIAQSKLARQDWDLFGEKEKQPSDLALRTPHIASARAALEAARVRMQQAQIQLARTTIKAPYEGRVLQRTVDIGQYVTPGTPLGKLFATDAIEVRLPLSLSDYELLGIPEHYQNEKQPDSRQLPDVLFYTGNHPDSQHQWQGKITRTHAALDNKTRQISVIARINQPFSRNHNGSPPVRLGQFLQADIAGKTLHNVAVIPAAALSEQQTILRFVPDASNPQQGTLHIQAVKVLHHDADKSIISADGLTSGSLLVITPPALATEGMPAKRYQTNQQKSDH